MDMLESVKHIRYSQLKAYFRVNRFSTFLHKNDSKHLRFKVLKVDKE